LIPEHLRLGTWDLLRCWTQKPAERIEPRLALQLVHEAALCTTGIRERRALSQKGFELVNGLPFLASDVAVHELLAAHTVAAAQDLQVALAKLRLARGHFSGKILAIDPHRVRSYSKRQMRRRRSTATAKATKVAQTFFVLDVDTHQPVCLTTGSSSRTVTQATPELLELTSKIFTAPGEILILADAEHFTAELLDQLHRQTQCHLLVPMPQQAPLVKQLQALPPELFTRRWAGFATAKRLYTPRRSQLGPFHQFIQRTGETPDSWEFKAFLATRDGDEVAALTDSFPKRWHLEEFFNANQALGWDRAGTQNLNIRFGQMSLALVAQAAIHQLRQRLGEPFSGWDAAHLAQAIFQGLDGDVRVTEDTIVVTYYNAPNAERLRQHYEGLPDKLKEQKIDPRIPWLYDFKLDFRFR
jgi:Transposase DDE domain